MNKCARTGTIGLGHIVDSSDLELLRDDESYIARKIEKMRRDVALEIMERIGDGRPYCVRVHSSLVDAPEYFENTSRYLVEAVVLLLNPDDAEIGESVVSLYSSLSPSASTVTNDVNEVISSDGKRWTRNRYGWQREA
jgi:hypothetical protein